MNPCHVVETVDRNFVVCHGAETDTLRRVCLINADGSPGISYSSEVVGQVIKPCHLAVDRDGFVFVADGTGVVLVLSPKLGYMWEVASPGSYLSWKPWRLCIAGQRLYVADNEFVDGKWSAGRVVVFDLWPVFSRRSHSLEKLHARQGHHRSIGGKSLVLDLYRQNTHSRVQPAVSVYII